ncbi:MAG: rbsA, ribose transport system ATP-binding protein [Gemmatimonadetes bacterium]|nr:rbsA, ribose transport system ATP-binding protein [Gemmatimonadota bacterium]
MADVAPPSLLRLEGITRRFGAVTALDRVDVSFRRGEVHALVGENGAGKSTLVKIMTGAYRRDDGEMFLDGAAVNFQTPAEAQAAGICAVHQEVHLLGMRTVAENLFLGREPLRWGLVDWRTMMHDARVLLDDLGLDIDPAATLSHISVARQQMVAIARGVSLGASLLVLDEPTSSLAEREVVILFDLIARLRARGTSIVYISHRLDEIYTVCDRVTVLRDGKLVATRSLDGLERIDLICLMLGKSREALRLGATAFGGRHAAAANVEPLLRARSIAFAPRLRDVSLDVQKGEIVGVAGLLGSGRSETAQVLFGTAKSTAGSMFMNGAPYAPGSPRDAMRAGIGFVSEDRKADGIIPELSVRENLTLAALPLFTKFGIVSRVRQMAIVDRYMSRLGIRASSADQNIRELSGGNQQKVLLARWLCTDPELLILDEPTRGIDIGARGEIQRLVNELAESGLGVLMISSELEELVEGCSRVVVLRDGRTVAELQGDGVSEHAIVHAMAETAL